MRGTIGFRARNTKSRPTPTPCERMWLQPSASIPIESTRCRPWDGPNFTVIYNAKAATTGPWSLVPTSRWTTHETARLARSWLAKT